MGVRLVVACSSQPSGTMGLPAHHRTVQDELAEARKVARRGLDAAAADLLPGLAQDPGGLLFHAGGHPDLFRQVVGQRLLRGLD
jgi:hypothetical protein